MIEQPIPAKDFSAIDITGKTFQLSDFKGKKILLSFYRNGSCLFGNLRMHELIQEYGKWMATGLKMIAVFESSAADILPYVKKHTFTITILPDPAAKLYNLYDVENSPQKIFNIIEKNIAAERIELASREGFVGSYQPNSNLMRMPADFLIDENFIIQKWHYSNFLIDQLSIQEISAFATH